MTTYKIKWVILAILIAFYAWYTFTSSAKNKEISIYSDLEKLSFNDLEQLLEDNNIDLSKARSRKDYEYLYRQYVCRSAKPLSCISDLEKLSFNELKQLSVDNNIDLSEGESRADYHYLINLELCLNKDGEFYIRELVCSDNDRIKMIILD